MLTDQVKVIIVYIYLIVECNDQESIRGDLLRQFQQLESEPDTSLDRADFLPPDTGEDPLRELAEVTQELQNLEVADLKFELISEPDEKSMELQTQTASEIAHSTKP